MKARKITAFALSLIAAAAAVSGARAYQPITAFAAEELATAQAETNADDTQLAAVEAKMTAQANGTVTLGWKAVEGADRYAAYKITAEGEAVLAGYADKDTLSYTFNEVEGNLTNKFSIIAEKQIDEESYSAGEYSEVSVAQPLYAPEFSLTANADNIKISWKKVWGATNYRIYSYNPTTKKYTRIHTSYPTTTSYTVKGLNPTTSYSYVVRAVSNVTGTTVFDQKMAARQSAVTKCITPVVTSFTSDINTVSLSWSSSGDVNGYQVWMLDKTTGSAYKKLGNISPKKFQYTVSSGLTLGNSYSFKVRAYKKVNGAWVYSAWSAVKSVTPKIITPEISSLKATGTTITVNWNASNSSIDGYQVWMLDNTTNKYVKLGNVSPKKLTYSTNKNIPAESEVKIKTRAYKKINGAWAYSAWSAAKTVQTGTGKLYVVIDPGHLKGLNAAGNDYDNVISGYSEATMSLTLAKYLKSYLEGYGIEVKLTRETDKAYDLDLNDRGLMAEGADFFISLHSNAGGASAQSVYAYCSVDKKSNAIGKLLSAAVAATMGVPDGGIVNLYSDDEPGKDYYCVLRNAAKVGVSGVMVEHSYHTNAYSRAWLLKDSNLKKLAEAEAKVIAEYFGVI